MFYNTTHLEGADLVKSRVKTRTQEELIRDFFKKYPEIAFTPNEINYMVFNNQIPITSVRRAMTDLASEDILEKTKTKRPGQYGAKTHCWRLRRQG